MKRRITVIAAAAVATLSLVGCSPGSSDDGDLKIGLIMLQGDTYFEGIQSAVEAAAEADGASVTAVLSNGDAGVEASAVQNMIQSKVDAILIQPAAGDASIATMKSITAAGIPLVCYGNCLGDSTDPDIVKGVIQSDNTALGTATGELAAEYIKNSLGGKAKIGILNCDFASGCVLRKEGFKAALEASGVEVEYVTDQEGYLADKATTVATNVLSANPEINLLWAANEGGTIGLTIGVKQSGKSVPVFGTDISTQLADFLLASDNILQTTTGQDPAATGSGAYEMAKAAIEGKENDPFQVELSGITFTRDNPDAVNEFLGK